MEFRVGSWELVEICWNNDLDWLGWMVWSKQAWWKACDVNTSSKFSARMLCKNLGSAASASQEDTKATTWQQFMLFNATRKTCEPKGPGQWNGPVGDVTVTFRGMISLVGAYDGKFPSTNVNESTTLGSSSSARLLEALRINVTFHLTSAQDASGECDPLQKCDVDRLRCVFSHGFKKLSNLWHPKRRCTWAVTCFFSTLASDCRFAESERRKTPCGWNKKLQPSPKRLVRFHELDSKQPTKPSSSIHQSLTVDKGWI